MRGLYPGDHTGKSTVQSSYDMSYIMGLVIQPFAGWLLFSLRAPLEVWISLLLFHIRKVFYCQP